MNGPIEVVVQIAARSECGIRRQVAGHWVPRAPFLWHTDIFNLIGWNVYNAWLI